MALTGMAATAHAARHVPVTIEVCIADASMASPDEIKARVTRILTSEASIVPGPVEFDGDDFLATHCRGVRVCELDDGADSVPSAAASLQFIAYQLSSEGPAVEEVGEGEDTVVAAQHWQLPALEFEGLWESLVLAPSVKRRLLRYAATSVLFSDAGVDPTLVSLNRLILLHGPPGTGKTTLCKALAHKLALRMSGRYPCAAVLEVNSHSLFSRWFSESGKLVGKLFEHIGELAADEDSLVVVLIDEVESLSGARQASMAGSEPSDAVRVVNALLTQLDALRARPNVLILATSNITEAIDAAFVDRADLKLFIGPPNAAARFEILASCVAELLRVGIVVPDDAGGAARAALSDSGDAATSSSSSSSAVRPARGAATPVVSRAALPAAPASGRSFGAGASASGPPARPAAAVWTYTRVLEAIGEAAWREAAAATAAGTGTQAWASTGSDEAAGRATTAALEHSDAPLRAEAGTLLTGVDAAEARLPRAMVALARAAGHSCGLSGRALRKLPFAAHAGYTGGHLCSLTAFCDALLAAVGDEASSRHHMAE